MSLTLENLVQAARREGASDLHLEGGLPLAVRVRGALRMQGEPLPAKWLREWALQLIGPEQWPRFLERCSFDFSKTIAGVRCRLNIMQTARGVGLAVRLLATFQATLEKLNLHPDLKRLVAPANGLVLISGPTGSGKSSTLAALIQEINVSEARHIVTIESPIEYTFRPRRAYIRQREVGRDTPSFEQALLDALREDPDVLMVGEMREPETMRLTLSAAETGHLVLSTVHSSSCGEALQRVISAFSAEIQSNVAAQLADCLVAVVAQRLRFRPDLGIRVPECEILLPNVAARAFIRNRDFFKLNHVLETGAEVGSWTFARYEGWLAKKTKWYTPGVAEDVPDSEPEAELGTPPPLPAAGANAPAVDLSRKASPPATVAKTARPIEIEPVEGGLDALLRKLG